MTADGDRRGAGATADRKCCRGLEKPPKMGAGGLC